MNTGTIDESQRKAATLVGFSYLFALPPAIFAEFYVRIQLIAFDNAAQTARNIMVHERLFRLGIASNLTVFAVDVVLIIALYVVLMPVNRRLALLATGWGLIETASLVVVTLSDFDVLRIAPESRCGWKLFSELCPEVRLWEVKPPNGMLGNAPQPFGAVG